MIRKARLTRKRKLIRKTKKQVGRGYEDLHLTDEQTDKIKRIIEEMSKDPNTAIIKLKEHINNLSRRLELRKNAVSAKKVRNTAINYILNDKRNILIQLICAAFITSISPIILARRFGKFVINKAYRKIAGKQFFRTVDEKAVEDEQKLTLFEATLKSYLNDLKKNSDVNVNNANITNALNEIANALSAPNANNAPNAPNANNANNAPNAANAANPPNAPNAPNPPNAPNENGDGYIEVYENLNPNNNPNNSTNYEHNLT